MALGDDQLHWLADVQRMMEGTVEFRAVSRKWYGRVDFAEWYSDPDFWGACFKLRARYQEWISGLIGSLRIRGQVTRGVGEAPLPGSRSLKYRLQEFGEPVEPGALKVLPDDQEQAETLITIVQPGRSEDKPSGARGFMLLWTALLHHRRLKGSPAPCWLLRQEHPSRKDFELMGRYPLRDIHGLKDGDSVEIELTNKDVYGWGLEQGHDPR